MVDFTQEDLRETMDKKSNIRNVCVIGHASHGKSTLKNTLVAAGGTITEEIAVGVPMIDTCVNEGDRSSGMCILYETSDELLEAYKGDREGNKYVFNLIDSPGHVDLCAEVTAALRVADGALLVIDPTEGVRVQTEIVLRQAIGEMIMPVLCLNKMDKFFCGLQVGGAKKPIFTGEQAYKILFNVVENSNAIIADCDVRLPFRPEIGSVTFSSGLHGWGFTITDMARKYASIFNLDESKFAKRLWGDNFFDSSLKKWLHKDNGSKTCKRGFVKFCYEPIEDIIHACMEEDKSKLWDLCRRFAVTLRDDEKELVGEDLFKCVMQTWLPASSALYEMMIFHLPSPLRAQKYRVEKLYNGPLDDSYAEAIRNCDPEGPLMLYVSKMIPTSDVDRFVAFGRVFSGRIASGMNLRVMGPSYVQGMTDDIYVKPVVRIVLWMGNKLLGANDVTCGNSVAIVGFHECITKYATLTNEKETGAWPMRGIKLSAPHVMMVKLKCKVQAHAHRLHDGLKRLIKFDITAVFSAGGAGETGVFTLAVVGEHHLEICLKDLERIMNGVEVLVSDTIVSHRETVLDKLCDPVETISGNQLNSLTIVARPLDEDLVKKIENGHLGPCTSHVDRSRILADYGWNVDKIWCFGPEAVGPNMIVQSCEITQHLELVKKLIVDSFELASKEGALAKESLRGICFEVRGAKIQSDGASRARSAQLNRMAKKALFDSQLAAKPRLLEPVYAVWIQCPDSALHTVNGILTQRGAYQADHFATEETMLFNLRAYVSVYDSLGLAKDITAATSGQVTAHFVFSYWDDMSCSPMQSSTPAGKRLLEIRQRKKMEKPSFQK